MMKTSVDANTLGYLWCMYLTDYNEFKKAIKEHGLTLEELKNLLNEKMGEKVL